MKHKRHLALLGCTAFLMSSMLINTLDYFVSSSVAEDRTYTITLNRDVDKVTDAEISAGAVTRQTAEGNPVIFKFDSSKSLTDTYSWIKFGSGNYFYNDTQISGIKKIDLRMAYGTFDVKYGYDKENVTYSLGTFGTGVNNEDITIDFPKSANYFRIENTVGNCYLRNLTISYSCSEATEPETPKLKTAVFADIQLTYKNSGTGYAANLGSTANAPLALKSHFEFCKKEGVDVILMNGDIANNAITKYYEYYTEIFEGVYGTDSSKYPEIIWNMGNHEWWDINEHDTATAVSLFNQYANIDSEYLVARSSVKYSLDSTVTVPSYYKVVNGIPFLVISGENSAGKISSALKSEIAGWLRNISNLPSVQAGGAIYVMYHYPLHSTFTFGDGASSNATDVEDLLADYPQAVVFTGDTHYPGVNERAINQVDFTTINLGSSSYSRMVTRSATMSSSESYYNLKRTNLTAKDIMEGNSQYQYEYTPTIQRLDVDADYSTKINRYFSTNNAAGGKSYAPQWYIPAGITKSQFTYTNARFQNAASAQALYGANGVSWNSTDAVTYEVKDGMMTVQFPDTNEYHFTEHYKITVTGSSSSKSYDCVSSYYKWYDSPIDNYFVLKDLPAGENYTVTVTAYDFFDNASINTLTATAPTAGTSVDKLDDALANTYTDISKRLNLTDTVDGTGSSIEIYYKGIQAYNAGATAFRMIYSYDPDSDCSGLLTLNNATNVEPVVTTKVKNLSSSDIKVGLTVVIDNGSGGDTWVTDFGTEYQKTVANDGQWHELQWNLKSMNSAITSKGKIKNLQIKMKSTNPVASGYEMKALFDNVDLINSTGENPEPIVRGKAFSSGVDASETIASSLNEPVIIDFKFDTAGTYINFMLGDGWSNYLGYFKILSDGSIEGNHDGVFTSMTEDGYVRVAVVPASVTRVNNANCGDYTLLSKITLFYIRGVWSNASGRYDINPEGATFEVNRGTYFEAGSSPTLDFKGDNIYQLTESVVIDFKFTSASNTYINFMLGDGWSNYFGYFKIYANGTLDSAYDGVSIAPTADGYYRVTLNLSQITRYSGNRDNITKINLFYARGATSNASGYYEIQPK